MALEVVDICNSTMDMFELVCQTQTPSTPHMHSRDWEVDSNDQRTKDYSKIILEKYVKMWGIFWRKWVAISLNIAAKQKWKEKEPEKGPGDQFGA